MINEAKMRNAKFVYLYRLDARGQMPDRCNNVKSRAHPDKIEYYYYVFQSIL